MIELLAPENSILPSPAQEESVTAEFLDEICENLTAKPKVTLYIYTFSISFIIYHSYSIRNQYKKTFAVWKINTRPIIFSSIFSINEFFQNIISLENTYKVTPIAHAAYVNMSTAQEIARSTSVYQRACTELPGLYPLESYDLVNIHQAVFNWVTLACFLYSFLVIK